MASVENESARVTAAMEKLKTFPVIDYAYRLEIVMNNDEKYQVICEYLDMEGYVHHTVTPEEAIADTPEGALEGWNRLIDEKKRV